MTEEKIEGLVKELANIRFAVADEVFYDTKLTRRYESITEICHYTSFDAAIQILESKYSSIPELSNCSAMRFGDVRYMNDVSELREGCKIIKEVADGDIHGLLKRSVNKVSKLIGFGNDEENMTVFAACFSPNGDDLRQWQAYGANGAGIVLKFDASEVCKGKLPVGNFVRAGFVNYASVDEKFLYTEQLFNKISELLDIHHVTENELIERDLCFGLLNDLALSKLHYYEDEKEIRFFYSGYDSGCGVQFYSKSGLLKPYIEMPIRKSNLIEVVLGPCVTSDENQYSFEQLLKQQGYENGKVTTSKIPYRG